MDLHQIQLTYHVEQDRLLFRVSFRDDKAQLQEIRAWLTRRFLRLLWPGILQSMERQVVVSQPDAAHARSEIVGMGHESSVSQLRESGGFDKPFEAEATGFPLGDAPILVTTAHFTVKAGEPLRVEFVSADRGAFEVAFTEHMLHGFCNLIREALKQSEWDLVLSMPGAAPTPPASRLLN